MALTFTESKRGVVGAERFVRGKIAFDASYPAGGEAYTAATFGLIHIEDLMITSQDVGGAEQVVHDKANSKLLVFTADGTQATNASDQSGVADVEVEVRGY